MSHVLTLRPEPRMILLLSLAWARRQAALFLLVASFLLVLFPLALLSLLTLLFQLVALFLVALLFQLVALFLVVLFLLVLFLSVALFLLAGGWVAEELTLLIPLVP
jgi:hypothetical protein